jgi:hypothetical protein
MFVLERAGATQLVSARRDFVVRDEFWLFQRSLRGILLGRRALRRLNMVSQPVISQET